MKYIDRKSNYDKEPEIFISENREGAFEGYEEICSEINSKINKVKIVVAIDCYVGVYEEEVLRNILKHMDFDKIILTKDIFLEGNRITEIFKDELTEDRVFGKMTKLKLEDILDKDEVKKAQENIQALEIGKILVLGVGAALICKPDIHVFADLARWEIQQRFRRGELDNYKANNYDDDFLKKYKRGYFIEWRLVDNYKKQFFNTLDYILDTNDMSSIKMITGLNFRKAMDLAVTSPFRVVPFFDPGVWGGQWMKEICELDRSKQNYAWCFDCVPEENSLFIRFGDIRVEVPSINLVLHRPEELLGEYIFNKFGAEFPIRFDFLDTMEGGNLSLQVHPLKTYINDKFGMAYTQDESYYMLDVGTDASVYLGVKNDIDRDEFLGALKEAQSRKSTLDVEKYINKFAANKHDHFLIPNGTIHCSGSNAMVLEISSTPYIFTFKLWDWGRVGLDGIPRPIHLDHGKEVIQFDRQTEWVKKHLVNNIVTIREEEGIKEEKTGLHELEFIETRRLWFNRKVTDNTNSTVNVLNLIEGEEVIIESPSNDFKPFIVHYAETFIIPAKIGEYTISPYGNSVGKTVGVLKAYVREENM